VVLTNDLIMKFSNETELRIEKLVIAPYNNLFRYNIVVYNYRLKIFQLKTIQTNNNYNSVIELLNSSEGMGEYIRDMIYKYHI
jgi:hypothetical protein